MRETGSEKPGAVALVCRAVVSRETRQEWGCDLQLSAVVRISTKI